MKTNRGRYRLAAALLLVSVAALQGCDGKTEQSAQRETKAVASQQRATDDSNVITVQHELGTAVLKSRPKRVVPYDMSVLDSLDQLGISIVGMPKDYVPRFSRSIRKIPQFRMWAGFCSPISNNFMR